MCDAFRRPQQGSAKAELRALGLAIGEALVITDMTTVVSHHRRSQLAAADQTTGDPYGYLCITRPHLGQQPTGTSASSCPAPSTGSMILQTTSLWHVQAGAA